MSDVGPFHGRSVFDLGERLRAHEWTSVELVRASIDAARGLGSRLNCFVTLDEEGAIRAAERADRERSLGLDRGPLHGIPVGVKDLIATDGVPTTMGSRHFAGHVPSVDADVVTALRRAGAVVVGKTQLHEFAFGPTGDVSASGPARNPLDVSRVPGGSSSGSAVAVAAGIVPFALGTDTAGSVRIPAALCGIVGLRPTRGSISPTGVFPLSPSLDVVGPLAASVQDVATAYGALSTHADAAELARIRDSPQLRPDPRRAEGLRVATVRSALTDRVTGPQAEALLIAADALGAVGAKVVQAALPELDECEQHHRAIQSAEVVALHRSRMQDAPELFEPEILQQLQEAARVSGWEYVLALDARTRLRARVLDALSTTDVVIMPTVPIEAPRLDQRELDARVGWTSVRAALKSMTVPWSLLDFPAISLPVTVSSSRMPGAVQLVAKPGLERLLLDAAALLESRLMH